MSSATDDEFGPFCGSLGCTDDADVVIDHPKHGELTVCDCCATGYMVVRRV
ncbi:hypothetical protein [Natrinema salaciae]|uniref:hypothetical protein n=1 Tax=Natrinema salaciae TaxID=1186196 RepID=UPI001587A1D8|nr:hypothetical protein [Natrinema salaciae]